MIQTVFLYVFALLISFLLAKKARVSGKNRYIVFLILILTLLPGLRAISVGLDTQRYNYFFELIKNGEFDYVWGVEYTYKMMMLLFSKVSKSFTIFILLIALLTNMCIILRFWDYRDIAKFEWVVAAYYVTFYFYQMNIMRQMCAVALVFFGSRYIVKGRYGLFLLFVAAGYLFHTSAVLGVLFFASEYLNWNGLSKRKKQFLGLTALLAPVAVLYVARKLSTYLRYFTRFQFQIGAVLPIKLGLLLLGQWGLKQTVIHRREMVREKKCQSDSMEIRYRITMVEICYAVGLLICFAGYIIPYADRISLYFYIYECVYVGIIMKYKPVRSGYPIVIALWYGLIFISIFFGVGQGQIPYLFFWQQG